MTDTETHTTADVPSGYPVTVGAGLDEPLNRWLWLVKWFLAIPHVIVLVLLWVAFVVLTLVAGVSIVFTGRYPRGIFDFNVGVMRWTWRVQLYAFTLATDRYPPFSLQPDPSYPAELEVDYPEQLSRGLVWVKWWLLAIPHYVIIGIFDGGPQVGGGLISVLALIAGVTLAVTQRYPTSIFDFIMGLHRWVWRVVAYAALMRDEYPPFRIDLGPTEPTAPTVPAATVDPE
jgi:hypothetical protein